MIMPSLWQLYNWIKNRNFKITKRNLILPTYVKGRRRKRGKVARMFEHWVFLIGVRSKSINERSEIGHWEIDTIMGQKHMVIIIFWPWWIENLAFSLNIISLKKRSKKLQILLIQCQEKCLVINLQKTFKTNKILGHHIS